MTDPATVLKQLAILYVDDDEEMWALLRRPLERRLREVHYARNGREGLEAIERLQPQVVVTDLQMPVMDGLEMITAARRLEGFDLPIIVVTAFSDREHHTDLADGYVFKPLKIPALMEKIVEVVTARGR